MSEPCANAESKGCKGPATDPGVDLGPAGSQEPRRLYCRGCGQSLPLGSHGQFHKVCLRADKRSRTREQRRRIQEKFKTWLQKQLCPKCGVRYGEAGSDRSAGMPCETSQSIQERDLGVPTIAALVPQFLRWKVPESWIRNHTRARIRLGRSIRFECAHVLHAQCRSTAKICARSIRNCERSTSLCAKFWR